MTPIDLLSAPLFVSWQMTRDCDLACLHCCTDSAPGKRLADELNEAEAMALAMEIVRAEVPYVMLCGGEPLLVPHFLKIAEFLGGQGVQLKIESNGQALDARLVERLARLPIRSIQISLDGDTQEIYGQQRPGASLARAHDACKAVRAAGLPLEITFAPTRLNLHQAEAVIERARAFGAFRFNSGQLMFIGRAAQLWRKIAPDQESVLRFRQMLDRRARSVDAGMEFCHDPFTVEDALRRCLQSPPATLLVLPNGWVKVAAAIGAVCADLRRDSLAEAWRAYRAAWRDERVIAAIERAVSDVAVHAAANHWQPLVKGVAEKCAL